VAGILRHVLPECVKRLDRPSLRRSRSSLLRLRWQARAEPPAGEHSEASEPASSRGERAPAGVERADGRWDVVPGEHCH
jgi:hypothetical protein